MGSGYREIDSRRPALAPSQRMSCPARIAPTRTIIIIA
jgi:hypothetical protein